MHCSALLCAFQTLVPPVEFGQCGLMRYKSDSMRSPGTPGIPPVQKPHQTKSWSGLACTPRLPSLSAMKCESSRALGVMINLDTCTQLTLPGKGINWRIMFLETAEASSMLPSQTRGPGQRGVSAVVCLDASFSSSSSLLLFSSEVLLIEF